MATSKNNLGLGDYIHLKWSNYLNQGTYRPQAAKNQFKIGAKQISSEDSIGDYYASTYESLRSSVDNIITTQSRTNDLELFLTLLFQQNYTTLLSTFNIDKSDLTHTEILIRQAIEQDLPKRFQFNRTNLSLSSNFEIKTIKGLTNRSKRTTVSRQEINDIEANITKNLKTIHNIVSSGQLSKKEEVLLRESQAEMIIYRNKIREILNQFQGQGTLQTKTIHSGEVAYTPLGQVLLAYNQLQSSIFLPNNEDIGTIAEITTAAGLSLMEHKTISTVSDLKKMVVGKSGKSSNIFSDVESFEGQQHYDSSLYNGKNWKLSGNQYVSVKTTQDTVDVQIDLNKDGSGENVFKASVKNYLNPKATARTGFGVISEVPFRVILGLLDTRFANHYLNYLVQHVDAQVSPPPEATNIVKYAIAVRAITGMRYKNFNKLSSRLILFDRTKRDVKIMSSADILNKISPSVGQFNDSYVKFQNFPNSSQYPNTSEPKGSYARISKILATTHQEKISMSLRAGIF